MGMFFGTAHSKEVTPIVDPSTMLPPSFAVNGASGRSFAYAPFVLQGKQGKQFKVERGKTQEGSTAGVLQKSAEATDAKRVGGMLYCDECGRV
jgi:hypothetical protein